MLSTCIVLRFVNKIFVLSFLSGRLTQVSMRAEHFLYLNNSRI